MSQDTPGVIKSFRAGDTLSAYRVVQADTATCNTVVMWATSTSRAIGVTAAYADSGSAIPVILNGTARCQAVDTITVGTVLQVQTATGLVQTATVLTPATGAANHVRIVGVAAESVSTGGVVEVILQPVFLNALT